ncbi:MAG: hypothetical protein KGY39_08830, partial [Anaerolineales bacterium]|nr:hypothetical protein [Anaerolineales bacterium]
STSCSVNVVAPSPAGRGGVRGATCFHRGIAVSFNGGNGPPRLPYDVWFPSHPCGSGVPVLEDGEAEGKLRAHCWVSLFAGKIIQYGTEKEKGVRVNPLPLAGLLVLSSACMGEQLNGLERPSVQRGAPEDV